MNMNHKDMNHSQAEHWFPLGVASDAAFCNRVDARHRLGCNLVDGVHSLISSPRRYGKTSLALEVLHHRKMQYATVDFMLVADEAMAQQKILEAVGYLMAKIVPTHKKCLERLKALLTSIRPSILLDESGFHVEFFTTKEEPQSNIVEALHALDEMAADVGKPVCLFMDEFQQLSGLENAFVIEAAIRHVIQKSKKLRVIFSGSNRHLLELMFQDSTRPLFHLCDHLVLDRIAIEHYQPFFEKAAKERWKKNLDAEVFNYIMQLTEQHPYYVNALCNRLWRFDSPPSIEQVNKVWSELKVVHKRIVSLELEGLSMNQRAMVNGLAKHPTQHPTGKDFLQKTSLSSASAKQVLDVLLRKDLIRQTGDGFYRILDPLMLAVIR